MPAKAATPKKAPTVGAQYLCTTPNPEYAGQAYGVHFRNGQAVVSDLTINKKLGLSLQEVITRLSNDFGYTVRKVTSTEAAEAEVAEPSPAE